MRSVGRPVRLAISAVLLVGAAPAARSFDCYKSAIGALYPTCFCQGVQDCIDMRHSKQCAGPADCQGSGEGVSCSCAAAKAAPVGGSSGNNGRPIKQAPTEAPPPTSAKPP